MRYALIRGTHGRFENGAFVQYGLGDTIELTAAEAESLKGRVQPAEVTDVIKGQGPTPIEYPGSLNAEQAIALERAVGLSVESEWAFLDDLHHVKAVEVVRGLDDSEQVQAALDYELSHKNRPSVTFAAKDRIKEIATAEGESSEEDTE